MCITQTQERFVNVILPACSLASKREIHQGTVLIDMEGAAVSEWEEHGERRGSPAAEASAAACCAGGRGRLSAFAFCAHIARMPSSTAPAFRAGDLDRSPHVPTPCAGLGVSSLTTDFRGIMAEIFHIDQVRGVLETALAQAILFSLQGVWGHCSHSSVRPGAACGLHGVGHHGPPPPPFCRTTTPS